MAFSKLLPIQTLAAALVLALSLLGVASLVGVGEASAQEDNWAGVAEFTLHAEVMPAQPPDESAESAEARESLQQLLDSASIRISVASDGTRRQQVMWDDETLLDLRADVSALPPLSRTPDDHTDLADVDPFDLPVAVRIDTAVAVGMAEDLGLSPGAGTGFPSMEEFPAADGEDARWQNQDLFPLLGTALSGGWIGVDGPLDPGQLPAERAPDEAQSAAWDVIEDHIVVTEPDQDQSLQEWEAAIDVPGLVTDLCALAATSGTGQARSCDELLDTPVLADGDVVVQVSADDSTDPIGLLSDINPDVTLTWEEFFELARQLR